MMLQSQHQFLYIAAFSNRERFLQFLRKKGLVPIRREQIVFDESLRREM